MASILDTPGLPTRANQPVFNEPWEARAFAITLTLQQRGLFTWPEWSAALAREIASAQQRGDQEKNHEQKKNGGVRRGVGLAAEDFGGARKFHSDLPLPFSVTTLTISAAARSMSRMILFTRLTR